MGSEIRYQGLTGNSVALAYCTDSPGNVLKQVFKEFRVYEFKGQDSFLSVALPGLLIREAVCGPPGTTITEKLSDLELKLFVPEDAVYKTSLSDDAAKKELVRHILKKYNDIFDIHHADKNYIMCFDDAAKRKRKPLFFKAHDENSRILVEATDAMFGLASLGDVREFFKRFTGIRLMNQKIDSQAVFLSGVLLMRYWS